jgi:hypothetical protein
MVAQPPPRAPRPPPHGALRVKTPPDKRHGADRRAGVARGLAHLLWDQKEDWPTYCGISRPQSVGHLPILGVSPAHLLWGLTPSSPAGPSRAWAAALARSRADALTRSSSPARASGARGPPTPPAPPSAHLNAPGTRRTTIPTASRGRGHRELPGCRATLVHTLARRAGVRRQINCAERHISCAILHQEPPRALSPLFLSVKTLCDRPHLVVDQRHVTRGLAHLLWKKEDRRS